MRKIKIIFLFAAILAVWLLVKTSDADFSTAHPIIKCPSLLRQTSATRREVAAWQWGSPRVGKNNTKCVEQRNASFMMSHLEDLIPYAPMRPLRCPTGKPQIPCPGDYEAADARHETVTFAYPLCFPASDGKFLRTSVRLIYIDAGARDYDSSVGWFRRHYPRGRDFDVYAFEVEAKYAAEYADDTKSTFVQAAVWDKSGWVSLPLHPSMQGVHGGSYSAQEPLGPSPGLLVTRSESLHDILHRRIRVRPTDFVVLKIDVEGAEWRLLESMARDNLYQYVDEIFLECHNVDWNPEWHLIASPEVRWKTLADCHNMFGEIRRRGVYIHEWY